MADKGKSHWERFLSRSGLALAPESEQEHILGTGKENGRDSSCGEERPGTRRGLLYCVLDAGRWGNGQGWEKVGLVGGSHSMLGTGLRPAGTGQPGSSFIYVEVHFYDFLI